MALQTIHRATRRCLIALYFDFFSLVWTTFSFGLKMTSFCIYTTSYWACHGDVVLIGIFIKCCFYFVSSLALTLAVALENPRFLCDPSLCLWSCYLLCCSSTSPNPSTILALFFVLVQVFNIYFVYNFSRSILIGCLFTISWKELHQMWNVLQMAICVGTKVILMLVNEELW